MTAELTIDSKYPFQTLILYVGIDSELYRKDNNKEKTATVSLRRAMKVQYLDFYCEDFHGGRQVSKIHKSYSHFCTCDRWLFKPES